MKNTIKTDPPSIPTALNSPDIINTAKSIPNSYHVKGSKKSLC